MWLNHLDGLRPTGSDKWRSRCPVHGGSNKTQLSIKRLHDNSYIVHCFSCGANGLDVFDHLGLDKKELFGDKEFKPVKQPKDLYTELFTGLVESEIKKGNRIGWSDKKKYNEIKS